LKNFCIFFVVKKNAGKKKILGWHAWATIHHCETPLQIGKVSNVEPSNVAVAFMFSWNATRTGSHSSSMPHQPERLTALKALVRSMKTENSGRDCSTFCFSLGAV